MSSVAFITLGCAKNEVDTDVMRAQILAAGHALVEDPAEADVVVVNTCAFIVEATEEAIATILEATTLPRVAAGEARLIVAGCLPSRYERSKLASELPEVTAFLSVENESDLLKLIDGAASVSDTTGHLRTVRAPWAYLKIAEGCDRFCSFCTIPSIRGRYTSRPAADIIAEAEALVAGGVRELVLIAQDTGRWSGDVDAGPAHTLPQLLDLLATHLPTTWLRVMYLQPSGITDELLTVMAAHTNICDYLDIPLQHASARVLRAMNRKGSGEEYLALLERIRVALPAVTLRTTVIAGFPGETRAEARELERFIAEADFDYVGVFPYSPEEGTVAGARRDQVPRRTRLARAQRLRDIADTVGFARWAMRIGSRLEVLVTEYDDEDPDIPDDGKGKNSAARVGVSPPRMLGRTKGQAPEVDGMVHLAVGSVGELVSVRISESCCYDLFAEADESAHG
ncbi:MAG: 30S ribosomal protein S12 methylthiotransferase RimO [Coriobacteriales bacterium]|jgi:ribosomal protein S12 methylthiotransferase|nr:30S ribosomal protein S12 methylthiotransferase RimO [Coriobacteriales bacterium]